MAKVQKTSPAEVTKEQLIADFKVVIADAEALIKATADQGDVALSKLRSQAETSLLNAKDKLSGVQEDLLEKGKAAAKTADAHHPRRRILRTETICPLRQRLRGRPRDRPE